MQDLARDLGAIAGAPSTVSDEQAQLIEAQGALRAFFDLFAAKAALALAGDPDERARLLSLIPPTEDRRHLRRASPERASRLRPAPKGGLAARPWFYSRGPGWFTRWAAVQKLGRA